MDLNDQLPKEIELFLDYKNVIVKTLDYVGAKHRQLVAFGYESLTRTEIKEAIIKKLSGKDPDTVIDRFVFSDFKKQ